MAGLSQQCGAGAGTVARARAARLRRERAARGLTWLGLALFVAVSVAPFLYVVSAAFRESRALFEYPPQWLPDRVFLDNFRNVLVDYPFLRWTANTLIVAGAVTALKLFFDSMAGYALARLEFPGRGMLFAALFATIMIPPAVLILPLFFIVRDLGGVDTYWALIVPGLANPVGIFMMRGFIQGLPRSLEDAARLEGCSEFNIYRLIILPLVRPGLVVLGIYTFLTQYISFAWPLVVTTQEDMRVLTTGVASLRPQHDPDWGLISAGAILSMVPITIVFLMFQRRFVQANLSGALKG